VLLHAIRDGVNLLTWSQDSFGFADSFDEDAGRYKGCAAARWSIWPTRIRRTGGEAGCGQQADGGRASAR
jgi:hypothetical protein